MDLKESIRSIPDFPEKGVLFRDITTLLKDPEALRQAIEQMQAFLEELDFDLIVAPESRGFVFGMPLAYNLKKGFVPIRKAGKLPAKTIRQECSMEYATSTMEVHADAIKPGQKVVIVDDLLATGGTCRTIINLIEQLGGEVVAVAFLIELEELNGRKALYEKEVHSVLKY